MLAYLQSSDLERILKEWGYPTLILFAVGLGIRAICKALYPLLVSYFEAHKKALSDAHELLKTQLEVANTRQQSQEIHFIDALKQQRDENIAAIQRQAEVTASAVERQSTALTEVLQEQAKAIKEQTKAIEEIPGKVRKQE